MTLNTAYAELVADLQRQHSLGSVAELLGWDEQVNLPPQSADQRAEQHAVLADVIHREATNPKTGDILRLFDSKEGLQALSDEQRAVIRQARRDYERATKLPPEFVREKALQGSIGYHAWAKAKAASDFSSYVAVLEKNLELARREAAYLGWGDRAYDYMLDKHDPGMTTGLIAQLFSSLKRELVPFVQRIAESKVKARKDLLRGFPIPGQQALLRAVTERLGFNYGRGRIDVSLHPFCSGNGADVRMTTRFNVDEPLDSLFSSIHETGHGLYEQGLPRQHRGTALGMHAGMGAHESQSRLWENQVSRSRGFWTYFEPQFRALFPEQTKRVTSDELYLAINAVEPTLIRVDADEVTYNLHIILRFEIEQRLFSGTLAVRDLPNAWKEASRDLLGLEPANDREGVLQDVHWSDGAFGYFPSYCLGNMMAAQLWYRALEERPSLETDFSQGDFSGLLTWLRNNVHAVGRRFELPELVQRVTGQPLSPGHLMRYLKERYGALYGA